MDPPAYDFHLRPGSPAAGTGKSDDMGAYPVVHRVEDVHRPVPIGISAKKEVKG